MNLLNSLGTQISLWSQHQPPTSDPSGMVTVSENQRLLPAQPRSRACETLCTVLKTGTAKGAQQTVTATVGALTGAGIKAAGTAMVLMGGTWLVIGGASALICVSGTLAGLRAGELVQARDQVSGSQGYLQQGLTRMIQWGPLVMPLVRAGVGGLIGGPPGAALSLVSSLASTGCSLTRDGLTAVLRGVLPDSKAVDSDSEPLSGASEQSHQLGTTVLATVLDAGLAVGGNSGLEPDLQGLIAPFDSATEVIIYGGLRGGFSVIQEGAKAIVAALKGGGLKTVDGKGLEALRDNLGGASQRKATLQHAADNVAMRIAINAYTGELMTGIESVVPGGDNPVGPARVFTSLALGAGESRSLFVDQGRKAETRLASGQLQPPV